MYWEPTAASLHHEDNLETTIRNMCHFNKQHSLLICLCIMQHSFLAKSQYRNIKRCENWMLWAIYINVCLCRRLHRYVIEGQMSKVTTVTTTTKTRLLLFCTYRSKGMLLCFYIRYFFHVFWLVGKSRVGGSRHLYWWRKTEYPANSQRLCW